MIELCPMTLKEANAYVEQHHRHHGPVVGHKFSIGLSDGEKIVGVAIVGRPVARHLDDGGHWKSIAYARTAHAMPVQCFTQQHGGRPARWDISVW